jgi:hypothetical protein
MTKKISPALGTATTYSLKFNQKLDNLDGTTSTLGSYVTSNMFTFSGVQCMLKDFYDTSSDTRIIQIVDTGGIIYNTNVGTVNETTGTVTLNAFNPTALPTGTTTIDVKVNPASNDIKPMRNELLTIDTSGAAITGEIDTMATGGTTAGIDYTTTESS